MHNRLIKDNFRHHYRLRLPGDSPLPVTIAPKSFWDLTLTETFVRHLRVPTDYWEQVLSGFPVTPYDPNRTLEGHVSQLLIEGRITLYPVSHLDQHHKHATTAHPIIPGENGISYQLAPASVLLVEAHSKIKSFASKEAAEAFIQGMNLDEAQLRGLCQSINLPVSNGNGASLMAGLGDALLDGKLVAIVRQSSVTPPVSADSASTSTASSTSKPVSLGPHAEGGGGSTVTSDAPKDTSQTFKDQDSAAEAALNKANPQSIKDNLEYGGVIYRNKATGEYGFTGPIKGSDQGVNPFDEEIPPGTELVGDYHTHADYSVVDRKTGAAIRTSDPLNDDFNSDNFSPDDIRGITAVGKDVPGYKGYLGTPSGKFKVYEPSTGSTSLLN